MWARTMGRVLLFPIYIPCRVALNCVVIGPDSIYLFLLREHNHFYQNAKYAQPMTLTFVTTWYDEGQFLCNNVPMWTFIYTMVQIHYFCTEAIHMSSKNILKQVHVKLIEWTESNLMRPSQIKHIKPIFVSCIFVFTIQSMNMLEWSWALFLRQQHFCLRLQPCSLNHVNDMLYSCLLISHGPAMGFFCESKAWFNHNAVIFPPKKTSLR